LRFLPRDEGVRMVLIGRKECEGDALDHPRQDQGLISTSRLKLVPIRCKRPGEN